MQGEKIVTDTGVALLGAGLVAYWHYAQIALGGFMLIGGAILLGFRLIIAHKENKIASLELAKLKKETE